MKFIFFHSKRGYKLRGILPSDAVVLEVPCYGGIKTRMANIKRLFQEVKKRKYDFILLDTTWLPLWICIMLKKMYGIKVVLRLRGNPFKEAIQKRDIISYVLDMFSLKRVDLIITVSEFLKNELLKYNMNREKIFVLNVPVFKKVSMNEDFKRDIFLFVTNFHFKEKVSMFSSVINKTASIINDNKWDFKIFIIGEGKYRRKIMNSINADHNKNVIFTGYRTDVANFYKRAKIFFHFSKLDAFPTVVQEALSYGIPVLANDYGSIKEMIEHGYNGFILNDLNELEKYIHLLVTDKRIFSEMSNNAIKSIIKWHPDILSRRLREILSVLS